MNLNQKKFYMDRKMCRLVAFQRNELFTDHEKKIRKTFGRLLFTKFFSYFINKKNIEKKYFDIMLKEYKTIQNFIPAKSNKILSIGAGLGVLEAIFNKKFLDLNFYLIEKDYVSKKIIYGWDIKNNEAYNDLTLTKNFMKLNGISEEKIKLFNFDKDKLPDEKFNLIISLYSLEYHYQLEVYLDYFKKVSTESSIFIFDTVNPLRMKSLFKEVNVIFEPSDSSHNSKRVLCRGLIN